jgi:molybdenum cofactor cytidylyltransferase
VVTKMSENLENSTLVVVLAAGGGSRFLGSEHKLDAILDGRTIAEISISNAVASGVGPVLVITGATEVSLSAPTAIAVRAVHNPGWAAGQSTSLGRAVAEAETMGADAIVVGLADQPFVTAEAWRLVGASESAIAVATYSGRRRKPVRLHRSVWSELPTTGDKGGRDLIRMHPELVEEIPCPGSPADIDTLEDLQLWQSRSSTNSL